MDNINVTPRYVLAGEATFTVSNQSGVHYTYHIYRAKPSDQYPNPGWFIKLLNRPDKYTYMGKVILPSSRAPRPSIRQTSKSRVGIGAKSWKVAEWALVAIWQVDGGIYTLPPGYSIKHEGRCGRCGHPLTTPESLDTGLGPDCALILGIEWKERDDRQVVLHFDKHVSIRGRGEVNYGDQNTGNVPA